MRRRPPRPPGRGWQSAMQSAMPDHPIDQNRRIATTRSGEQALRATKAQAALRQDTARATAQGILSNPLAVSPWDTPAQRPLIQQGTPEPRPVQRLLPAWQGDPSTSRIEESVIAAQRTPADVQTQYSGAALLSPEQVRALQQEQGRPDAASIAEGMAQLRNAEASRMQDYTQQVRQHRQSRHQNAGRSRGEYVGDDRAVDPFTRAVVPGSERQLGLDLFPEETARLQQSIHGSYVGDANAISRVVDPIASINNPNYRPSAASAQAVQNQLRMDRQMDATAFAPDMAQMRLDLGAANAPIQLDGLDDIRIRHTVTPRKTVEMINPDGSKSYEYEPTGQIYQTPADPVQIETPHGPLVADPISGDTVWRQPGREDPKLRFQPRQGLWNNITQGLRTGFGFTSGQEPRTSDSGFTRSVFELLHPGVRQQYTDRLDTAQLNSVGRIAAGLGALGGDLSQFGSWKFFWRGHPMDVLQSQVVPKVVSYATGSKGQRLYGLQGADYKRYTIPLGIVSAGALGIASGNTNLGKIFDVEEGPRPDGFKAIKAEYGNPTEIGTSYPMALYQGLMTGASTGLLSYPQFAEERPDVSYERYKAYQDYLWGIEQPGTVQLLDGFIKGTSNSIDAPEDAWAIDPRRYEARIAGFKVNPIGIAAAAATLGLGYAGIGRLHQRRLAHIAARKRQMGIG